MNYQETTEYLFTAMPSFQNVGGEAYKPGLERIEAFCKELGDPHRSYPVIHVAGTNGKGSTSHMMASVLQSAGYRVGLFTSPHLRDFRERMRVCGEMISESCVVEFVAKYRTSMECLDLSFFEMTAAMAFDFFARSDVDVAVIETGLGGRLDATNVVIPELSIITNIGIDHTQYLGATLRDIAAEKAGIIKSGRGVVVGERNDEYCDVMVQKAEQLGAELWFATDLFVVDDISQSADLQLISVRDVQRSDISSYHLDLLGSYQSKNLLTLLAAVKMINSRDDISLNIPNFAVLDGLRSVVKATSLIGRWQRIAESPTTICDTGHNAHGLREVATQLTQQSYTTLYCVLGFARDKDLHKILSLFPADTHFIFTRAKVERAFATAEIAQVADVLNLKYRLIEDVTDALNEARRVAKPSDMIFVGGSNFVVAQIL